MQWGNNASCVFKLLEALIHCFFREICFPKLNFQNSEHLITLLQAFFYCFLSFFFFFWKWKKKRWEWGREQLGLVLVKPDLSWDLFFSWLQIRCLNQAVYEDSEGMFMGLFVRLILEHQDIPRGQSAQVHCLLEMSLGEEPGKWPFFPVGGHPSIINGMASPSHSKMKAAQAVQGDCLATSQSQSTGKWFQLTFLLVDLSVLDVGT